MFDDESFEDNQKVLKEIVELLHQYQVRYPRKQKHLSDFFELLLTTGLKQESGQFFTPPPVARFIVRSLPVKEKILSLLNQEVPKLPAVIDYAAGSGHFITEMMEEVQNTLDAEIDTSDFFPSAIEDLEVWKRKKYDWAKSYIYGIEKDDRLVKVAKVGCYFYGDGLAQVIEGDGLDSFEHSTRYRGLLEKNRAKPQFDFVVSNPPYSVKSFKRNTKNINFEKEFDLYQHITDQSSEIEALFIERTVQLLREGGIAAIVLPSSILSNTGIYTKARELILKNFEIIAITELGSNTFMATGTNTVVLFLKKREENQFEHINTLVAGVFEKKQDVTINGIEQAFSKYIAHVWDGISFADYQTLLEKNPNETIQNHEIFQEYEKKIQAKNEAEQWEKIFALEQEKITYFLLTYLQEVVLVKSGKKKAEKEFLGYEFSNRRGCEGTHPIQRGKSIDECTKLFDPEDSYNENKASTYILEAFEGTFDREVSEEMKSHVSRVNLADMLTFDRVDFEKQVSLSVKKKIRYENIWQTDNLVFLGEVAEIMKGTSITSAKIQDGIIPVVAGGQKPAYFHSQSNRDGNIITISASGAYSGFVNYFSEPIFASDCNTVQSRNEEKISTRLIFEFLKSIQSEIYGLQRGQAQPHVYGDDLANIKIPLPPLDIQQKIIDEIEVLGEKEMETKEKIERMRRAIEGVMKNDGKEEKLENIATLLRRGKSAKYGISNIQIIKSGQARGYKNFDFSEKHCVQEGFILDERKLEKGDILINSSGVGTAGRVTQFNLEGDFVVDSHITILRLDPKKALSDYVLYSLAGIGFKTIESMATGQSGQIELSLTIIQNIKIPLPPLSKQQRIVAEIETIEEKIQELEQELTEIPVKKEAILKKYL